LAIGDEKLFSLVVSVLSCAYCNTQNDDDDDDERTTTTSTHLGGAHQKIQNLSKKQVEQKKSV
jgi:hypothetical protein